MTVIYLSGIFFLIFCAFANGNPISNSSLRRISQNSFVRIVGGQDADIADYPYQVSVLIDGQHACGGSIIANNFILSAAHCFAEESRASHITIRAGSTYRTTGGQVVQTKTITAHPNFNEDTYDYDIAVVELASPLVLGTNVQTVSLPPSGTAFSNGENSVATGWGLTRNDGDLADVLQVVTLPLITTATCKSNYYGSAISSRMFCAGAAGKDSCFGDSGGPLVSDSIQLGIVSWGDVCGQASTPGVYTKVTEFLSFINSIISVKKKTL
uniref:Peptidase S1 domain-containing protein n=1 Tax=Dendroctonus ponderosae TaxID=77166 RepID=A0AAR5Q3X1_DENPD